MAQKPRERPFDPFADVPRAQELARESVIGFGETLKPHLLREIGTTLGGLNAIGSLRSGGATVALGDITTDYAQQIGAFAKQAAGSALGFGLEAGGRRLAERRQRFEEDEAKRRRKSALLRSIGSVLGAGVGFLAAGPPGAAAGSAAGGALGGAASSGFDSPAFGSSFDPSFRG